MIGYDRFLSGRCPKCGQPLVREPQDVIGDCGKADRLKYENSSCPSCGEKYARLVKERRPAGTS